jgi:hypothetical protein
MNLLLDLTTHWPPDKPRVSRSVHMDCGQVIDRAVSEDSGASSAKVSDSVSVISQGSCLYRSCLAFSRLLLSKMWSEYSHGDGVVEKGPCNSTPMTGRNH